MNEENLMGSLGRKHGTDKIVLHEYHEIFPQYIEKFYDSDGAMLEIGMARGASLNMWLELFPNMHIYGMDRDTSVTSVDRTTIIQGDQSSLDDLNRVRDQIKHPLLFVNDDGSHIPEHQLLTFNTLFPLLEIDGVYIIEDIETSYWTKKDCYGYPTRYGIGHEKSIIEVFKTAIDGVNHEICGKRSGVVHHQEFIHSITFSKNCIIIIKKSPDDKPYNYKQYL